MYLKLLLLVTACPSDTFVTSSDAYITSDLLSQAMVLYTRNRHSEKMTKRTQEHTIAIFAHKIDKTD